MIVPPVTDMRTITDNHSIPLDETMVSEIPPASDLSLAEVCHHLYLDRKL